jgi:hypothetical protein
LRRIASALEIESILPKFRYMQLSYNGAHPNGDSIKLRCNGNFVPPIFTASKFDGENAASYVLQSISVSIMSEESLTSTVPKLFGFDFSNL